MEFISHGHGRKGSIFVRGSRGSSLLICSARFVSRFAGLEFVVVRVTARLGRPVRPVDVGKNRYFADLISAWCLLIFRLDFCPGSYLTIVLISVPAGPGRLARLGVVSPELTQCRNDHLFPISRALNYLMNCSLVRYCNQKNNANEKSLGV